MPSLPVSNGDGDTLVAAPGPAQFIRVIGLNLTTGTQSAVSLKSDSTVIWPTDAMNNASPAGGGIVIPTDPNNTIDCANGKPLKLGASGGATIKGSIEYVVKGLPNIPPG